VENHPLERHCIDCVDVERVVMWKSIAIGRTRAGLWSVDAMVV
jgi:hypothetical protein